MTASTPAPGTLYLCYFGVEEPLVQKQVLPYLRGIASTGWRVHLLSFELSGGREVRTNLLRELEISHGIRWHSAGYHKRPAILAKPWDILRGAAMAAALARRHRLQVLHARSHVALLMARLARLFAKFGLIFDLRGLMAEEYVDAGLWRAGSVAFRAVKAVERWGLRHADEVVVLTDRMRERLLSDGIGPASRLTTIPCCTSVKQVVSRPPLLGADARLDVVYAGSVSGLYLLEDMGRFVGALKSLHSNTVFTILTREAPATVSRALTRAGLSQKDFSVGAVSPDGVSERLERASVGISFRKPTESQIAASPTKVAEYLSAGLPVVTNSGIGDLDALILQDRVGVTVPDFDEATLVSAAGRLVALLHEPGLSERCLASAQRRYDLDSIGVARYAALYRRLLNASGTSVHQEPE